MKLFKKLTEKIDKNLQEKAAEKHCCCGCKKK